MRNVERGKSQSNRGLIVTDLPHDRQLKVKTAENKIYTLQKKN